MRSTGMGRALNRLALVATETKLDEHGHERDNDAGADSTMVEFAHMSAFDVATSDEQRALPSFIMSFAKPVQVRSEQSTAATMTETFKRSGEGERDTDAHSAVTMETETRVSDPTGRDTDASHGGYAPIGNRRSL